MLLLLGPAKPVLRIVDERAKALSYFSGFADTLRGQKIAPSFLCDYSAAFRMNFKAFFRAGKFCSGPSNS